MSDEITKYLREDEKPGLPRSETATTSLEERLQSRLVTCRWLMEKHQYQLDRFNEDQCCVDCGQEKGEPCYLDCKWAQAIDTGRK